MRVPILNVLLVFLLTTGGCELVGDKKHPTDTEMIANFNDPRLEFDRLIEMFMTDRSLGRVGAGFTRPANFFEKCSDAGSWNGNEIEVSAERIRDYEDRFVKLGLRSGIEGYCEKEAIHLYASSIGLSVTGSSQGYAYLKNAPKTVVEDLDSYWSQDGRSFTAYRRIDGDWYLFFDYED